MVGWTDRARRRRRFAVVACVLWLLGVEVLPNLHLAFHEDADHTHSATGEIVAREHVSERLPADHDHAFGDDDHHAVVPHDHHSEVAGRPAPQEVEVAEHHHGDRHAPRGPRQLAFDHVELGHAAGGLAHRALALHQPPPPLLAPIPVERATWWIADAPIERTSARFAARPNARGPPA